MLALALVLVLVLAAVTLQRGGDTSGDTSGGAGSSPPPDPTPVAGGPPWFGTLVSQVQHTAAEADAGLSLAMVELSWEEYEPAPGRWDAAYAADVRTRIEALLASGRRVTLGLGLHHSPRWLLDRPGSRFVDQAGTESADLNVVFDQRVRREVEDYLARVARDLPLARVDAVRLTSGGSPEVLYPGGGGYWAFDANARNGPDMPPSMAPNPFPDWRPGQPGLDTGQVRSWADWYVGALADVVRWQVRVLDATGFTGDYQVLTPGSGIRPAQYDQLAAAGLPRGLLGTGAAWHVLYAALPAQPRLVAYVSSVADTSGDDDRCRAGDRGVALADPAAQGWSATRWLSRVADEHGLAKSGENPGWNAPARLNGHYRDAGPQGMMAAAVAQAGSCGFQSLYWAHDDQLWDGTVSLGRLRGLIADAGEQP